MNKRLDQPTYVVLKLTDACNLKCYMCGQVYSEQRKKPTTLDLDIVIKRLDELEKLDTVLLFGGEPFLYPGIERLIEYLKKRDIYVLIITNGVLLDKYIDTIIKNRVDTIGISIDAVDEEVYNMIRGDNQLDKVLHNVKALSDAIYESEKDIFLGINCVILKQNYNKLKDIYTYFQENIPNVKQVSFEIPRITTKQLGEDYEKIMMEEFQCKADTWNWYYNKIPSFSDEEINDISESLTWLKKRAGAQFRSPTSVEALKRTCGSEYHLPKRVCDLPFRELAVLANGDVTFCADYPDYIMGNIYEDSLLTIWNSEKANKMWSYYEEKGNLPICGRCSMGHALNEKFDFDRVVLDSIPTAFYGSTIYDEKEIEAVSNVIKSKSPFRYDWTTNVHVVDQFEDMCKEYFGVSYAHCVNSGMGALSSALHALEVGIGDEVIVPGYLFVADINAILLRGALPVLCEVDESLSLDPDDLVKKITDKTKCVIMIHMDGSFGKVDKILQICKERGIKVLEDFSQAIGASINGKKVGSFGDIAVASFQQNKMITSGEGGIILTNSREYYKKSRLRSDSGLDRKLIEDEVVSKFLTYGEGRRFSEISAAVMMAQLPKLDNLIQSLNRSKRLLINWMGDIGNIKYREVSDPAGDASTNLAMIFESEDQATAFWDFYVSKFPDEELHLEPKRNAGYHIYYNCTNLVNKVDALPGGFPWMFYDKDKYFYGKGALPFTDALLERTISVSIPAGMKDLHVKILSDKLKCLIRDFWKEYNG